MISGDRVDVLWFISIPNDLSDLYFNADWYLNPLMRELWQKYKTTGSNSLKRGFPPQGDPKPGNTLIKLVYPIYEIQYTKTRNKYLFAEWILNAYIYVLSTFYLKISTFRTRNINFVVCRNSVTNDRAIYTTVITSPSEGVARYCFHPVCVCFFLVGRGEHPLGTGTMRFIKI